MNAIVLALMDQDSPAEQALKEIELRWPEWDRPVSGAWSAFGTWCTIEICPAETSDGHGAGIAGPSGIVCPSSFDDLPES